MSENNLPDLLTSLIEKNQLGRANHDAILHLYAGKLALRKITIDMAISANPMLGVFGTDDQAYINGLRMSFQQNAELIKSGLPFSRKALKLIDSLEYDCNFYKEMQKNETYLASLINIPQPRLDREDDPVENMLARSGSMLFMREEEKWSYDLGEALSHIKEESVRIHKCEPTLLQYLMNNNKPKLLEDAINTFQTSITNLNQSKSFHKYMALLEQTEILENENIMKEGGVEITKANYLTSKIYLQFLKKKQQRLKFLHEISYDLGNQYSRYDLYDYHIRHGVEHVTNMFDYDCHPGKLFGDHIAVQKTIFDYIKKDDLLFSYIIEALVTESNYRIQKKDESKNNNPTSSNTQDTIPDKQHTAITFYQALAHQITENNVGNTIYFGEDNFHTRTKEFVQRLEMSSTGDTPRITAKTITAMFEMFKSEQFLGTNDYNGTNPEERAYALSFMYDQIIVDATKGKSFEGQSVKQLYQQNLRQAKEFLNLTPAPQQK